MLKDEIEKTWVLKKDKKKTNEFGWISLTWVNLLSS
jgi:hypothetical protein